MFIGCYTTWRITNPSHSIPTIMTGQFLRQSDIIFSSRGRDLFVVDVRRRWDFLFLVNLAEVSAGRPQTLSKFLPLWSAGTDMAPSTQLKVAIADVQEEIRAILLGPPGAGKGTQVRESYSAELSGLAFSLLAVSLGKQ